MSIWGAEGCLWGLAGNGKIDKEVCFLGGLALEGAGVAFKMPWDASRGPSGRLFGVILVVCGCILRKILTVWGTPASEKF